VGLEYDALSLPGTVLVTALAEDPNNVHIIYRFYLNEEPETKWVHENKFVLNIIDKNINKIKIGDRVKDDRNTNEDEFDDSMNRTCSIGK